MPRAFDDVGECVESTLSRVGPHVVLALPLGIGKPNPLVNEFYRRAQRDPSLRLKIFTALSLRAPQWSGELERRFLEPLVTRLFGGWIGLDYVRDLHAGKLPDNVQIVEFFLDPGALLNVAHSQQHYLSSNYTHVARDVAAHGGECRGAIGGKAQRRWARRIQPGLKPRRNPRSVGISCAAAPAGQRTVVVIGEVNRQMPFMLGPAAVGAESFDLHAGTPAL